MLNKYISNMRVEICRNVYLFTNSTAQPEIETAENKIFDCHSHAWPPLVLPLQLKTV